MNLMKAEKRLLEILLQKSFKYSEEPVFKLVSGRMSNYYINCKTTTLDPEAMLLIGHLFYQKVKPFHIHAIGGLTLGADPIAFATAMVSGMQDDAINAFVVRKKAKEHGLMKWIEGNVREGDRVVIVDDVVTTGQSTIDAIDRARESNLHVMKAIALVDRQEGGRENIERKEIPFEAVFTREDLMSLYKRS
ncbi:MAG: orotate phosphoribosyltransferase [Candidatus Brocadia sp.]|jgi:orotate phosphoribosyltransferase (EC 2.4.2.10)|nr:orotate phosphoribosyltransferase [Candidatus Brocadia sp.]MCE7911036.1 orotate phosphoribosyltransferase [Candidatus Brocadia sp. AMX3]MDG5996345.1 orotate phosphoribosyltransferase [Candidatus Brocadia sp.]RIK02611.1 MAG: orotate phosphoribosyltransferase [Candidatus Brocadia sp.]